VEMMAKDVFVRDGDDFMTKSYNENDGQKITFLQVSDIQKMMGISRANAYALVKQKGFPHIVVGTRIVIPFDLFNEWILKKAT
jgi:hypothetical protein